jgi:hypothetical protein
VAQAQIRLLNYFITQSTSDDASLESALGIWGKNICYLTLLLSSFLFMHVAFLHYLFLIII